MLKMDLVAEIHEMMQKLLDYFLFMNMTPNLTFSLFCCMTSVRCWDSP